MKKLIIGFVTLCLITLQALAWHIDKTQRVSSNELNHFIVCDSGNIISVIENTSISQFFIHGKGYGSMSEAVNANCN